MQQFVGRLQEDNSQQAKHTSFTSTHSIRAVFYKSKNFVGDLNLNPAPVFQSHNLETHMFNPLLPSYTCT